MGRLEKDRIASVCQREAAMTTPDKNDNKRKHDPVALCVMGAIVLVVIAIVIYGP